MTDRASAEGLRERYDELERDYRALEAQCRDLLGATGPRPDSGIDVDMLARVYTRIRNAHDADDYDPAVPPCSWCVLAAEQHIKAMERYARLSTPRTEIPLIDVPQGQVPRSTGPIHTVERPTPRTETSDG